MLTGHISSLRGNDALISCFQSYLILIQTSTNISNEHSRAFSDGAGPSGKLLTQHLDTSISGTRAESCQSPNSRFNKEREIRSDDGQFPAWAQISMYRVSEIFQIQASSARTYSDPHRREALSGWLVIQLSQIVTLKFYNLIERQLEKSLRKEGDLELLLCKRRVNLWGLRIACTSISLLQLSNHTFFNTKLFSRKVKDAPHNHFKWPPALPFYVVFCFAAIHLQVECSHFGEGLHTCLPPCLLHVGVWV